MRRQGGDNDFGSCGDGGAAQGWPATIATFGLGEEWALERRWVSGVCGCHRVGRLGVSDVMSPGAHMHCRHPGDSCCSGSASELTGGPYEDRRQRHGDYECKAGDRSTAPRSEREDVARAQVQGAAAVKESTMLSAGSSDNLRIPGLEARMDAAMATRVDAGYAPRSVRSQGEDNDFGSCGDGGSSRG